MNTAEAIQKFHARRVFEGVGTVSDLIGDKGWLEIVPDNLARTDGTRVMIILVREDDSVLETTLSPALSEMVRSKELSLGDLLDFQVSEQTNSQGEKYFGITREWTNGAVKVGRNKLTKSAPKAPEKPKTVKDLETYLKF